MTTIFFHNLDLPIHVFCWERVWKAIVRTFCSKMEQFSYFTLQNWHPIVCKSAFTGNRWNWNAESFLNSLAEKRTVEDASADKKCCGFHSGWVSTSLLSCPTGFLHMLSHGRARNSSVLWIRCWQRLPRCLTTRVLSHRVLFLESISHVACEWVPGVVSIPVWSWHHIVHVMGVCSAVSSHKICL